MCHCILYTIYRIADIW